MNVMQGVMTPQQARLAIMPASQPYASPEQGVPWQLPINNQISPLQHVIRDQDPLHPAHQFSTFIPQDQHQHQQNDSGFASRAGQTFIPPGVGFPQGQAPLQQGFIQPCPGQQVPISPGLAGLTLPQLRGLHAQMMRFVIEGEKNLQASSATGGEGDIQRQQLRAKVEVYKQRLIVLQDFVNAKTREM